MREFGRGALWGMVLLTSGVLAHGCAPDGAPVEAGADAEAATRARAEAQFSGEARPLRDPVAPTLLWTRRGEDLLRRILPSVVDQPSRARVLMFGGWTPDGVFDDTWEWDGQGWIRRVPDDTPGTRMAAASVFDSSEQRVLLFGGFSTVSPHFTLADDTTWEWRGNNWAEVVTRTKPTPRFGATFVWDGGNRRGFMFGGAERVEIGEGGSSAIVGSDTMWTFDGLDWAPVPKTGVWPPPRLLSTATWDVARKRMVLHGGLDGTSLIRGDIIPGNSLNDTWEWDGASWRALEQARVDDAYGMPTVFYEPDGQRVFLLAERGNSLRTTLYELGENTWVPISTRAEVAPGQTSLFESGAWSSANRELLLIGGIRYEPGRFSIEFRQQDWLVSLDGGEFRALGSTESPSPREGMGMAVLGSDLLLFGGFDNERRLDDTFGWDGGRWTRYTPATRPSTRTEVAMAEIDDTHALMFGGYSGSSRFNDTWLWDHTQKTWEQLPLEDGHPGRRSGAGMVALGQGKVLMFGGMEPIPEVGGTRRTAETWIFDATDRSWTQLTTAVTPTARDGAAMDRSDDGRVFMYGGITGDSVNGTMVLNDFWAFDGASWEPLTGPAFNRRRARMATDRDTGRTYSIGGTSEPSRADVLDVTEGGVIECAPIVREDNERIPRRRHSHLLRHHGTHGGLLMFGGAATDSAAVLADTWQLRSFGASCAADDECGPRQFCTDGVCCEASSCGPCGSCAGPTTPGLCTPRGEYGAAPGCEDTRACSADGTCRLANEQSCTEDTACASGTCINAQSGQGICCALGGCAVRCIEGELQNPDGSRTSCGTYGCEADGCKTSCSSITDCAVGAVCTGEGLCVAAEAGESEEAGCSCRVGAAAGGRGGGIAAWLLLAAGVLVPGLRRRSRA